MSKQLSVKLKIDAEGNVSGVVRDINNDLKNMDGQVGKVADSTDRLTGALKHVGHYGAAAFAGWGLSNIVGDIIGATKEMQSLQASLVTVKGSAVAADKAFAQIQEFATTTPYRLAEVTDAFIKMEALGLSASQRAMRSYGDTASSMGKSLNQMVEAVADAATGEFERLKEFGIKASSEGDRVKFTFRGVTTEVGKNAAEIEDYLIKLGEINFTGGMARQMETLGGQLSNLEDNWQKALNAIGTASQPAMALAIDSLNDLANGVETAADYIDEAAYLAAIGLTTALTAKAIPAVWAASTAFNAATASAGGFAAATRAATAAALAFAATPVGLAVTAMAGGVAYLALREDETEVATRDLTEALKAQNIELSKSEIKLKAAELAEYRQQLRALIELKNQNGAVDVLGFKQAGLEEKIARLEQGKSALVTVQEMLNEQEREFVEISDEASGAYKELERNAAAYAETISFIAQTENEWRNESAKERASIQDKINALTLTEAQQRQLIIDKIQPENRALMQKLFLIQDQAKAQKEAESVTEGMIAAVERENAAIYAKSDAYLASQEALLAYKQAMQADGEAFNASIDNIALSVESIGDAWTRTGDKASEAIASMAKTWMDFEKQQGKAAKDHEKIDAARFDNLDKYYQGIITLGEYKKNEAKLDKKQAELEEQNIDNQIALYYGLAGAMSGAFKEGSKEAEAFRAIQQSIALFDGIRAVINAWAAPFPTNLAMVPLTTLNVAALLGQMGLSFSGGSAPGLSISSVAAPDGSPLGSTDASTSVSNVYERMIDLEADQYNELRGIYREMQALNKNMTGVVSSLYATGDLSNLSQGLTSSYSINVGAGLSDFLRSDPTTQFLESLPVIGQVFGALNQIGGGIFEGISSGLFGSTKKSTSGYGLYLPTFSLGNDLDLQSYQTIRTAKDGGWLSKTKISYRDYYSQISGQSEDLLNRVFDNLRNGMIEMGEILGRDVQSQVDAFTISIGKISTAGKSGEEIQKALTEAISKQSDQLAYELFDDLVMAYGELNESAFDTVSRLGVEKAIAEDILSMTNQTFTADAIAVSQALVNIADGIDALKSAADSYFDAFYSDAEKQERLYEQLTGALDSVNLALPQTRDGYRDLVESLNLGTAAGQEQYVMLMQLADAADHYYDNLEQNAREAIGAFDDLGHALGTAAVSIEQMAEASKSFGNSLVQSAMASISAQSAAFTSVTSAIKSISLQIADINAQSQGGAPTASDAPISSSEQGTLHDTRSLRDQLSALESIESTLERMRLGIEGAMVEDSGRGYQIGMMMLHEIKAGTRDAGQIDQALDYVASLSIDQFATRQDYERARAESLFLVKDMESSYEQQIDPLQAQINELEALNDQIEALNSTSLSAAKTNYLFEMEASDSAAASLSLLEDQLQTLQAIESSLQAGGTLNQAILQSLDAQYKLIDENGDNAVSLAEFQAMFGSVADAQTLKKLFELTDVNGDGIISLLEAINAGQFTAKDQWIAELLPILDTISTGQLTPGQVVFALQGLASEEQAVALFNALDADNNGILTKLEVQNGLLADLSPLLADVLQDSFGVFDQTLDGVIDWSEFHSAFNGLATDAVLMAGFQGLDVNLDGMITRFESSNSKTAQLVEQQYESLLSRQSDISGQDFWIEAINSGKLATSELPENIAQAAIDNNPKDAAMAINAVLADAYKKLFGREVTADGLSFWGDALMNGTISVASLESELIAAAKAANNDDWKAYQQMHVPAFASGGVHSGGLRLVGEMGPELEFTGPSRIVNNNDTLKMLDNSRLELLVEKMINRIEELEEQAARTAVATQDSADLLKYFSRGLPVYNIEV